MLALVMTAGAMRTAVGFVAQGLDYSLPGHHAASHGFPWDVGRRRGRGCSDIHGAEKTVCALHLLSLAWTADPDRHTGAGGEATGSGESLTLVVVGSDDLGLLRVLFLRQASC